MQEAKKTPNNQPTTVNLESYIITINVQDQNTVSFKVIDKEKRIQYQALNVRISVLSSDAILKAVKGDSKNFIFNIKAQSEENINLEFEVQFPFLQNMKEVITLTKTKTISQIQYLSTQVTKLRSRVNDLLKKGHQNENLSVFFGSKIETQQFRAGQGQDYESLAQTKLRKGNYILTFSFIVRPNNSWVYFYFNNNPLKLANESGFYFPGNGTWHQYTIRLNHTVTLDEQLARFQTFNTNYYSFSIRNCILTAKRVMK